MGERLLCKQEVIGSIPFTSTKALPPNPVLKPPIAVVARQGVSFVE